jgi:hypothetical protein
MDRRLQQNRCSPVSHVTGLLHAVVTLQTLNRSMQTGITEDISGRKATELGTQKGLQAAAGGRRGPIWYAYAERVFKGGQGDDRVSCQAVRSPSYTIST